ncbi:hypothetical protein C0J52_13745 [Blattella germanica]|nr:hypothetical protein C0J52_13745 [Blattella germanica]
MFHVAHASLTPTFMRQEQAKRHTSLIGINGATHLPLLSTIPQLLVNFPDLMPGAVPVPASPPPSQISSSVFKSQPIQPHRVMFMKVTSLLFEDLPNFFLIYRLQQFVLWFAEDRMRWNSVGYGRGFATAAVAMSRTKLSPFLAGAAREMGFVPRAALVALVGLIKGEVLVKDMPSRPCSCAVLVYQPAMPKWFDAATEFCRPFYEKHRKGMPLTSDEKRIVLNVFYKLSEKYPEVAINDIMEMTSEFTGVSVSAIYKARIELKNFNSSNSVY